MDGGHYMMWLNILGFIKNPKILTTIAIILVGYFSITYVLNLKYTEGYTAAAEKYEKAYNAELVKALKESEQKHLIALEQQRKLHEIAIKNAVESQAVSTRVQKEIEYVYKTEKVYIPAECTDVVTGFNELLNTGYQIIGSSP